MDLLGSSRGVSDLAGPRASPQQQRATVRIERDDAAGRLAVFAGAHEIVGWRWGEQQPIPHWFPLRSPSGKDLVVERPDPYPHHSALWIADKVQLGDGPVVDFYHCTGNQIDPKDPARGHRHRIRQTAMPVCEVRDRRAVIAVTLQWLADGEPVLDDQRTLTVLPLPDGEALLDLDFRVVAAHGPVRFHSDEVHYAWPLLRLCPQWSAAQGGALVDDTGRRGQSATNGQYANWIDYSNTVDGTTEGVAVFVPQDGAWRRWLTRDYGAFGPRRDDAVHGRQFVLEHGRELAATVRILVHRGDAATGKVASRYRDFVAGR